MKQRATRIVVLLAALGTPSSAHAHLVNSGLGPFYDGALHLLLSPLDIVRLSALGLFAGAQVPAASRSVVVLAPVAWLLASTAGLASDATGIFDLASAVGLFLLGAAVALNFRPPAVIATAIAAAFGGLLGFASGVELRADNAKGLALVGTTAVVLVLLLLVISFVASAKSFVSGIVCRVLGSWAAATGLLSIGWIMASNH